MGFPAPNVVMGPVDFMKPVKLGTPVELQGFLDAGETDGCLGAGGCFWGRWMFGSQ
ncbi:hypothetical protein NG798_22540 [Ancylothrix sp. C2]|uniref:hypothetical protein n=1 Tax=Ancylothrix sp. D3o TaxID=2953691 RepID=UPI0021BB6DB2|nr:hypothetical protein [Ancylothrix sp. D3o]MCT7952579.1 hypothetical protein [Ancylothrix sp. D3o]